MNKRKWIRIALALLGLYALATVVGGISLAEMALHPPRRVVTEQDDSRAAMLARSAGARFQVTSLVVPDETELRGWLFQPSQFGNGDFVMVFHGVSDSRRGVFGLADFLLRRGYAVLVPDSRAHGDSGGYIATYGIREAADVAAWAEMLQREYSDLKPTPEHVPCVYAIGGSMGGAIALQSMHKRQPFCAVVAEAPFSDFREIAFDRAGGFLGAGDWLGRTFFRAPIEAGLLYARWRYDVDLRLASPLQAVRSSKIPILLIHGEADANNPIRHARLLQAANPNIELWAVPGLGHTSASGVDGEQFQRRVLELFARGRNAAGGSVKQASP